MKSLFEGTEWEPQHDMDTLESYLKIVREVYPFLEKSESSSRQQARIDLQNAFKKHENEGRGYPKFQSRKTAPATFRIANNGNIKINQNTITIPKLGTVYYRTSPEYKYEIQNPIKLNHIIVKRKNGKYYIIVNIQTTIITMEHKTEAVGIDLGMRRLLTTSDEVMIANIDLSHEEKRIRDCQKALSRKILGSNRYKKLLKTYWKWIDKLTNKVEDAYNKLSLAIVKKYGIISMEKLNIKGMFQNHYLSPKLQKIGLYQLKAKIRYKSEWHDREFVEVSMWFASSKICSNCGYYYKQLGSKEEWTCPECGEHHDRDINAAKNIKEEGLNILKKRKNMNLGDPGDSTVKFLKSP